MGVSTQAEGLALEQLWIKTGCVAVNDDGSLVMMSESSQVFFA